MLRKTQLVSAGLLTIAVASTVNADTYAGIGLGSDTIDFHMRSYIYEINPGYQPGFAVFNKSHLSATGLYGTLFAGYSIHAKDKIYLAGEGNLNVSSTVSKGYNHEYVHQQFTYTTIKIKDSIGLSLLPGYQFTPNTLFYGRVGFVNSTIQETTSDISLLNYTKKRTGFRYGLGIKQNISDRWALRMDYSRIDYTAIDTSTYDPVGKVNKLTKITPNQQLIEFGLVLNFV